jgi:LysR family glycine cleavage system transcriptional activator
MSRAPDRLPPLNWLRSFEACARLSSFTAAAAELNVTQSAVSQQIKLLEAHLHEDLFFRSGRKMQLTEAGRNYVYFVREAFDMIRVGTQTVFDAERGRSLTLRANMAFTLFWLMPRLPELYVKHPWINLNILPHIWDSDERPAKSSISIVNGIGYTDQGYRPLRDEYFFPVCSPDLLATGRVPEAPHFNSAGMTATWEQWHKSGHGDLDPQPVNYTTTVVVSLMAAANGVGLALSHTSLFGAPERAGQLVRPFDGELRMQERYFISEPNAKEQTPAAQAFLDWMGDVTESP